MIKNTAENTKLWQTAPQSVESDYATLLGGRTHFFDVYENAGLCDSGTYQAIRRDRTYHFSELSGLEIKGFPNCITRDKDGKLNVTFTDDTHVLVLGATRSGKTTGFVLPFLNTMPLKKNKPSIVVSDPKKELYRGTCQRFRDNGYRVIMLDFQDYSHSDCWNPLSKIYRAYRRYLSVEDEVTAVREGDEYYNVFRGVTYRTQTELGQAIAEVKDSLGAEVDNMIISISERISPVSKEQDPYWDMMSATLMQGFLWAMLEDSVPGLGYGQITEDTYSFDTILRIVDTFTNSRGDALDDRGYFSSRDPKTSKAYQLVYGSIIGMSATVTRSCILSNFLGKVKKFRDTSIRRITCTNTFDIDELDSGKPTVIFVAYKDEDSLHYDTISLFLSDLYTRLIAIARNNNGTLNRPFYFLLDEFGNFPCFASFENVISACGSRNIWFLLIVQSYAQLERVYGKETAAIIIDNLNMHIFFGSGNYDTKRAFSEECGSHVIFSPLSAINGNTECIERYEKEYVPLIPISRLGYLENGECIITQMYGDVVWSRIERSYLCPEYDNARVDEPYASSVRFSDPKYTYTCKTRRRK